MKITEIYSDHKNAVYRLALTYLHNVEEAEDVTQDVFLKLIANGDAIVPGKERAWLLTATANLCKDRLRFWKRHEEIELTDRLAEELPGAEKPDSAVLEAVMSLPVKERTVIHLHYYEGFSTAEIAKIQGITQTAVTTRLARGRKHLKLSLEDCS